MAADEEDEDRDEDARLRADEEGSLAGSPVDVDACRDENVLGSESVTTVDVNPDAARLDFAEEDWLVLEADEETDEGVADEDVREARLRLEVDAGFVCDRSECDEVAGTRVPGMTPLAPANHGHLEKRDARGRK